ncbi:MAG TPA: hypothetical protein VMW52_09390 [Phycisphaerae bacterium]|nr:hypothetical protein [Phycisphaerae bacterium]
MAWTDLPATAATDWTAWSWRAQFAEAIWEREEVMAPGPYHIDWEHGQPPFAFVPDTDAQAVGRIVSGQGELHAIANQQWQVERLLAPACHFINPDSLTGGGRPGAYARSQFWRDLDTPEKGWPDEDLSPGYSPPGGSVLGRRYAVLAPASGDWTGHDNEIAICTCDWSSPPAWAFEVPPEGHTYAAVDWSSSPTVPGYARLTDGAWTATSECGWTRKRPRELADLELTGEETDGDRGRLIAPAAWANTGDGYTYRGPRPRPPAEPVAGVRYGAAADAEGAWAGQAGQLATWTAQPGGPAGAGSWAFVPPTPGEWYLFAGGSHLAAAGAWHAAGTLFDYDDEAEAWLLSADQLAAPDTIILCGRAREGDYVGPWLFNELYAAIRRLHMVMSRWNDWGGSYRYKFAMGESEAGWPATVAACEADWSAGGDPESGTMEFSETGPDCWTNGWRSSESAWCQAECRRHHMQQKVVFWSAGSGLLCDVKFVAEAAAAQDGTFNAMGDAAASQTAVVWQTLSGQADVLEYTSGVWELARAGTQPSPWPDNPPVGSTAYVGYCVPDNWAWGVKDFSVAGGFEYP